MDSNFEIQSKNNKFIVAGYSRISPKGSSNRDKEVSSLEIQTKDILKEINDKQNDWRFFKMYSETVSGSLLFEKRPQGSELMKDANEGKFNLLIVWDNDRLGRDREGMASQMFRYEMRKLGIQIYSLHQPQIIKNYDNFVEDPYDDGQILMEKIQDWQSASTINKFVHRSKRGRIERSLKGEMITIAPYGYKLVTKKDENGDILIRKDGRVVHKRVIDENEKQYVVRIYNEYVFEAKSMNQIVDCLNRDNVPTRKGGLWERAMVSRVLKNPIYYGLLIYNKHYRRKNSLTGTTRWGQNSSDKWVVVQPENTQHIRIIEKRIYDLAQEIRIAKLKLGAVSVYNDYLFSGILKCGICNAKFYTKKFRNKYRRKTDGVIKRSVTHGYVCSKWVRFKDTDKNYISEESVEKAIIEDIKKYKNNPQVLKSFMEAKNSKVLDGVLIRLKILNKNMAKVEIGRKRMLTLYKHENISEDAYLKEIDSIDSEVEGMQNEKNRLEKELADENKREKGRKTFVDAINNFEEIFKNGNNQIKKAFLRSLVSDIVIKKYSIRINYIL